MELKDFLQQEEFLVKCQWGISLISARLQMINAELGMRCGREVIHRYSSRIKSYESIAAKLRKKGVEESVQSMEEYVNDVVGIRAVCTYTDDLYRIGEMLCAQQDIHLIKKKDYIRHPKKSGYRSLHLIFQVPVSFQEETRWVKIEVQLRTGAMDYWAGLDYQLQYKKENRKAKNIGRELKAYANAIEQIDSKVLELRKRIEAI
ncbi:GTP pyrophosphokinase [Petralouisia muris]|jgi:putative GTP pyrophosphokinase|uniref:GTP pyrophosphokinase n=1 Tax=Petralouisia muris TaxID=3032872 RepID=A0AC61RQ25_9FIRM|nr:GTP pyrophosphokinase [Petralouisia muris]TGY91135.1 GTP pyrophosphokinase [Petralouisia muris]